MVYSIMAKEKGGQRGFPVNRKSRTDHRPLALLVLLLLSSFITRYQCALSSSLLLLLGLTLHVPTTFVVPFTRQSCGPCWSRGRCVIAADALPLVKTLGFSAVDDSTLVLYNFGVVMMMTEEEERQQTKKKKEWRIRRRKKVIEERKSTSSSSMSSLFCCLTRVSMCGQRFLHFTQFLPRNMTTTRDPPREGETKTTS